MFCYKEKREVVFAGRDIPGHFEGRKFVGGVDAAHPFSRSNTGFAGGVWVEGFSTPVCHAACREAGLEVARVRDAQESHRSHRHFSTQAANACVDYRAMDAALAKARA